jgi:hypothetical protein
MRHGFVWVTTLFLLLSMAGHWAFGWVAYANEQEGHGQPADGREFAAEMMRDTFENWQSEFLQLIWQVVGLAFLWHVGSSQSKEGDDRKEEKIDALLEKAYGPAEADRIRKQLEKKYPKG